MNQSVCSFFKMVADKDNQGQDAHLEAVQNFTLTSFKLKPQDWREFLSKEDNQILLNSFFNAEDNCNMFLCQDSEGSLCVSLNLPPNTQSKLICVSKTGSKVNTAEGASKILNFQEVAREDALSIVLAFCDEVGQGAKTTLKSDYSWLKLNMKMVSIRNVEAKSS